MNKELALNNNKWFGNRDVSTRKDECKRTIGFHFCGRMENTKSVEEELKIQFNRSETDQTTIPIYLICVSFD